MKKLLLCAFLVGCSSTPTPKTVELDLCAARRAYVALNLGLDPTPGSPRAKLEALEDALCATIAP